MKISRYEEMERLVSSSETGSALAVVGPDPYQSIRLQNRMISRFRDGLEFEVSRFDAGELAVGDMKRVLAESSLFSGGKLVVISQVHRMGKPATQELLEALEGGLDDSALFITSEKVPRESSIIRKLQKLIPLFICYDPFEKDIPGWIRRLSSEEGIELDRSASGLLSQFAGRNLQRLAEAVTRLALFHGKGSRIGQDGVREVLSGKGGMDIFHLGDMIFCDRRGDALDAAVTLIRRGEEPINMIGYLFSLWQKVVVSREILDGGGGKREITAATGARYPLLDKLLTYCRKGCRVSTITAAEAFAEADRGLKTSVDSEVVFSRLIFALTKGQQ